MEKALAIANSFIALALKAGNPVTQMKLQKLIFFAHGWYLALSDTPLLDEHFQAWQYGPVVPSVYHEFKSFGTLGIDKLGTELSFTPSGFDWISPTVSDSSGTVQELVKKIWDVYGKYSGTQLSDMTHAPNTPWTLTRKKYGDMRDVVIPDELIKKYFKELIGNGS